MKTRRNVMNRSFVLFITLLLIPLPICGSEFVNVPESTKQLLQEFSADPELSKLVLEVQNHISQYEEWFGQTESIAKNFQVDAILQLHDFTEAISNPYLSSKVKDSQDRIKEFLEKHNWEVIGQEGTACDPLNYENFSRELLSGIRKETGQFISPDYVIQMLKDYTPYDGVLMYMEQYPKSIIIGLEDYSLLELHNSILNRLGKGYNQRLDNLGFSISNLRSKIALAKVIRKLHFLGKKRGVIVIGYLHENSLRALTRDLKTKSEFYYSYKN